MRRHSIFISYRRSDRDFVDGLQAELERRLGDDVVFRDVRSIEPGDPFPRALENAIEAASVMLVIIGPGWGARFESRAPEEPDYVEHELVMAHARGLRVIPLLVHGAAMPRLADLPDQLRFLAQHQAVTIADDGRLGIQVEWLSRTLGGRKRRPAWAVVAAVIAVLGAGVGVAHWRTRAVRPGEVRAARSALPAAASEDAGARAVVTASAVPDAAIVDATSRSAPLLRVRDRYTRLDKHPAQLEGTTFQKGFFVELHLSAPDRGPLLLDALQLQVSFHKNARCPAADLPFGQGTAEATHFRLEVDGDKRQRITWTRRGRRLSAETTPGGNLFLQTDGQRMAGRRVGGGQGAEAFEILDGVVLAKAKGLYELRLLVSYYAEAQDGSTNQWLSRPIRVCAR